MERTKNKAKADAIIISDLHLADTQPPARIDNYIEAQTRKLKFIQDLANVHECPIICAGDIFHHWKASPWLCNYVFAHLPRPMITIPGNHDLPNHSLEDYGKSGLALLDAVDDELLVLGVPGHHSVGQDFKFSVEGVPFGQLKNFKPNEIKVLNMRRILMIHELTWLNRPTWSKGSLKAEELLEEYGEYYDVIITGDNHESFMLTDEKTNTTLVNPGAMMRMYADKEGYQPVCYLYYAEDNLLYKTTIPIISGVLDREVLDKKKEKDNRIDAYIARMNEGWEIGISFEKNLEAFFAENGTPGKVSDIIWQQISGKDY